VRPGNHSFLVVVGMAALALAAAAGPGAAATRRRPVHRVAAKPAAPAIPTIASVRAWSAPQSTRIVLDLAGAMQPIAPDSGEGTDLTVSLPTPRIRRAAEVPVAQGIADGVVDSLRIDTGDDGATLKVWLHTATSYKVFALDPEGDKPSRLVVDIVKPGAAAAESSRLASIASAKAQSRTRIVAVDAGHGGEDPGARGPHGVIEKRVTLAVARFLVDELNRIPGIQATLTRDGDYFIPLRDRYRIAEKMKADLFISIHANSSRRWTRRDKGSEVYFLSLTGASDQADRDLADIENAADLVGGVPQQAEDDLVNILYDVKRSSALQQSQLLAEALLDNMTADRRLEARGVKQAGFAVLKSVEFPSVLVETAYINNPTEAKLLASPDFQHEMGRQLAIGVRDFFTRAGVPIGGAKVGPGVARGGSGE
jgi:N-acetylmuramoyl-L-alanine amidase